MSPDGTLKDPLSVVPGAEWDRVVYESECDEYGNCPLCGTEFPECGCPGDLETAWEYVEYDGVAFARRVT